MERITIKPKAIVQVKTLTNQADPSVSVKVINRGAP